ncbi:MAG TPA: PD-(D/E)XK nuclease family protein [Terriglobia bacterium]|nr:PD-(D/E)XK nuclease family protein [Terriglobia bacterium]
MDLHVYRNSQDRWHDLRSAARERGAVLAVNAVTLEELVERLTPEAKTASSGQRLVLIQTAIDEVGDGTRAKARDYIGHPALSESALSGDISSENALSGNVLSPDVLFPNVVAGFSPRSIPNLNRYAYDAVSELKGATVRASELRKAGATFLADVMEKYDKGLRKSGLFDPQDRRALAASRTIEKATPWLDKFSRIVLHALYDLTEAEFSLVRVLIETLPDGGAVILFNTTANIKPTQFAEWTWQRFIRDESLADKTFPEFCRVLNPNRAVLERLFADSGTPLPSDDGLRIFELPGRYKEIEKIGGDICDLILSGQSPNEIAVVVRHIESYGEMLEDVFSRYGIPYSFETGVPLLRIPFIKYWLALLDLVTSERSREAMGRVMSSAYHQPRLSPRVDVERVLAALGYIDRTHLRASALARRRSSQLTAELERFEQWLDELETSTDSVLGFLNRLRASASLAERDRQAWRLLAEELEAVSPLLPREGLRFAEFRRIASEIAGLRTVDRSSAGSVAPGLPRVRIMKPHSLGYRDYKWIFAPGFADGEFPARSSSNPLLRDEAVEAINGRIHPRRIMTSRDRNRREPLYLFTILDSATQRVTLTYPGSTLEGEPIYPSVYVGEIARHYEDSPILRPSPGVPRAEGEFLSMIADAWRSGSLTEDRATELLGRGTVARANLERKGIARAHIGRAVLPLEGVWHPSELNALSACPFVFLARHRLKLRASETPDFEVPAMEVGILAHSILRDFYNRPVPSSIEEARARMNEIITRRLSAADISGQGPYSVFDPSLWKIRRRQLVSVLNEYVNFAVRDAQAGFETQPEYLDSALPPAGFGRTRLAGKPDHVAVHRTEARIDAIRIDDFKYSAASSSTTKQLKQSFQIPVYAWLAVRALDVDPGIRIEGRYLLLRSPGNPVVSYPIDDMVFEEVRARIDGLLDKVSGGKLHPDPADRQDCADCEYRRLCRLYGM